MKVRRIIAVLILTMMAFSAVFCENKEIRLALAKSKIKVTIKVGKKSFSGVFYNNVTSKALLEKMPVSYKMSELNGNEKYKYLDYDLPANEVEVNKIKAGDIMLYGSNCIVVFYKSFDTTYKYMRIGRITKTKGLKKALGEGRIKVRFSKK